MYVYVCIYMYIYMCTYIYIYMFFFWDRVSLCISSSLWTLNPPASASPVLGLCHNAQFRAIDTLWKVVWLPFIFHYCSWEGICWSTTTLVRFFYLLCRGFFIFGILKFNCDILVSFNFFLNFRLLVFLVGSYINLIKYSLLPYLYILNLFV
jgi:hypothetical protein